MIGCIPSYKWQATPVIPNAGNDYFDARIETVSHYTGAYINGFKLTVANKSDKDIEIDWNKTLYLYKAQTHGGFMFEGIVYTDRNNPKSPDMVFANSTLTKTIYPNNRVSFGGYPAQWSNDPLQEGENGVYLTMRCNGQEVHEKLVMGITIDKQ